MLTDITCALYKITQFLSKVSQTKSVISLITLRDIRSPEPEIANK